MQLYNQQLENSIEISADTASPEKPRLTITLKADLRFNEYFKHNFSNLQDLGYTKIEGDELIIQITSTSKVIKAIETISSQRSYRGPENKQSLLQLNEIKQNLQSQLPKKMLPFKSKNIANYELVNDESENQIKFSNAIHAAQKVKKRGKKVTEIFKKVPSGRRITEIEAFNGLCYRLLLNAQTPKVRSVHDENGQRIGVFSRAINNFASLHDYYRKYNKPPIQSDLIKSGIGRILAAAYCEEENDLHWENIGFDPVNLLLFKIDHDQAAWPFTSKYRNLHPLDCDLKKGRRAYGITPTEAFPITQRDINNFPYLTDAKPRLFPDKAKYINLEGMADNEDVIIDVFTIFFKRILLNAQIYRNIAEAAISSKKLGDELAIHKTNRTNLLKNELIENNKFSRFVISHPRLKEQLIDEFKKYNKDYKPSSPLYLDLEVIGKQFDQIKESCEKSFYEKFDPIIAELFERHYQPEKDYGNQHFFDSNLRKAKLLAAISSQLKVNKLTANRLFMRAHAQWLAKPENNFTQIQEQAIQIQLNNILKQLISLDGKLGMFGGNKRRLDNGREIKIANGAAVIFDQLVQYKKGEMPSSRETLEKIIFLAKASNNFKGHYFFNRRQKETSLFYSSIIQLDLSTMMKTPEQRL